MSSSLLRASLALIVIAIVGALPGGASACACGPNKGSVVAHGRSPYGVPWLIKGQRDRGHSKIEFSLKPPGFVDARWAAQLSLPLPHSFVLRADFGTGLDPQPESDLSGVTSSKVETVAVSMTDGSDLVIHPSLAPRKVRRKHPWLRGLRFFDQFFNAGPAPQIATATDGQGHTLALKTSDNGSF